MISGLLLVVFFLSCGDGGEKDAAAETVPEYVTVKSEELKVRNGPNSMTSEVGNVFYNMKLKVLKRSPEKVSMGNFSAHWYQIRTEDGLIGWVYGAYLDAELQVKNSKDAVEKKNAKIREMMHGVWYIVDDQNKITHWYLKMDTTKKIVQTGFREKLYFKGEYEESISGHYIQILVKNPNKFVYKNIMGELRGNSFIVKAEHEETPVKFTQTSSSF